MLGFLGVFGGIAVTASGEQTHCAALRRQRSEVRIFPSAPFLASIPAERIAFRPVRIIAGVQMVVHYDEGICSLSLSDAASTICRSEFQSPSSRNTEDRSCSDLFAPQTALRLCAFPARSWLHSIASGRSCCLHCRRMAHPSTRA